MTLTLPRCAGRGAHLLAVVLHWQATSPRRPWSQTTRRPQGLHTSWAMKFFRYTITWRLVQYGSLRPGVRGTSYMDVVIYRLTYSSGTSDYM